MANKKVDKKSIMGYRDDSQYRNEPFIDINTPTGFIDMSKTGMPLLANGQLLPPYSGQHDMGTTKVREVPFANGGSMESIGEPKKPVNKKKKKVEDTLLKYMNEYGITNPYMQQALMGVVMAEGGIGGKSENSWRDTPNDRIREYFGARVADTTDSQLTKLKKNDAEFFDKIYGPSAMDYYENIQGWDPGNNKKGDGYKYRGRGLNQLTFKSSYAKMQKDLKKRGYDYDLVKHPELLDTDTDLQALVAVNFLESRLSQIPKLVKNNPNTYGNLTGYQNYNDNITSFEDASYLLTRANAGWGKKVMPEIHDKKLKAAKNYKWDTDYTALADYKENQRLAAEAKEYNRVMDSRSSVPVDPTNLYQAPSGPRQEEYFDQDRMDGMMKSKLAYANEFGNPAAKRMVAPTDQPYNFDNGNTGTHFMSSMDNYAVPQIQNENGQLQLGNYGPQSNEAIRFDNNQDAEHFARGYKDAQGNKQGYKKIAPAFNQFGGGLGVPKNIPTWNYPSQGADIYRDTTEIPPAVFATGGAMSVSEDPPNKNNVLIGYMNEYGITNPYMQRAMMGIIMSEGGVDGVPEDMYYSKERLPEVWGKFSKTGKKVAKGQGKYNYNSLATKYEKSPEELGNFIYGNRLGNNNNNGYKYRGRGLNQLTGYHSYKKVGEELGVDLVNNPELLDTDSDLQAEVAVMFLAKRINEELPRLVKSKPNSYKKRFSKYLDFNNINNLEDANFLLTSANAGFGNFPAKETFDKRLNFAKNYKFDEKFEKINNSKEKDLNKDLNSNHIAEYQKLPEASKDKIKNSSKEIKFDILDDLYKKNNILLQSNKSNKDITQYSAGVEPEHNVVIKPKNEYIDKLNLTMGAPKKTPVFGQGQLFKTNGGPMYNQYGTGNKKMYQYSDSDGMDNGTDNGTEINFDQYYTTRNGKTKLNQKQLFEDYNMPKPDDFTETFDGHTWEEMGSGAKMAALYFSNDQKFLDTHTGKWMPAKGTQFGTKHGTQGQDYTGEYSPERNDKSVFKQSAITNPFTGKKVFVPTSAIRPQLGHVIPKENNGSINNQNKYGGPIYHKYGAAAGITSDVLGTAASIVGNVPVIGTAIGAGLGAVGGMFDYASENAASSDDGKMDWKNIDYADAAVKTGAGAAGGALGTPGSMLVGAGEMAYDQLTDSKADKLNAERAAILNDPSNPAYAETVQREQDKANATKGTGAIGTGIGIVGGIVGGEVDKAIDANALASGADAIAGGADSILNNVGNPINQFDQIGKYGNDMYNMGINGSAYAQYGTGRMSTSNLPEGAPTYPNMRINGSAYPNYQGPYEETLPYAAPGNKPTLPNYFKNPYGSNLDDLQNRQNPLSLKNGGPMNNGGFGANEMNEMPVTEFGAGGTHTENPNGGIKQGVNSQGQVNLVEEGELKFPDPRDPSGQNQFIVSSDKGMKLTKAIVENYDLPKKYVGKTVLEVANKILRKDSNREGDSIEENSKRLDLIPFVNAHAELSDIMNAKKEESFNAEMENINAKYPGMMDQMLSEQQPQQPQGMPQGMPQGGPGGMPPEMQGGMPPMLPQGGMPGAQMSKYGGNIFQYSQSNGLQNASPVKFDIDAWDNKVNKLNSNYDFGNYDYDANSKYIPGSNINMDLSQKDEVRGKQSFINAAAQAAPMAANLYQGIFGKEDSLDLDYASKVRLDRINADQALRKSGQAAAGLRNSIVGNTSQGSGVMGNLLAAKRYQDDQDAKIYETVNNQNANIDSREALANANIEKENLGRSAAMESYDKQVMAAKKDALNTGVGQLAALARANQQDDLAMNYNNMYSDDFEFKYDRPFKNYFSNEEREKRKKNRNNGEVG
jgi:predicted chitinase